jgi:uncharacterized membrane protein
MRSFATTAILLLAACGRDGAAPVSENIAAPPAPAAAAVPAGPRSAPQPSAGWGSEANGAGASLWFQAMGGRELTLSCPGRQGRLVVNVRGFRPIGSEERMSLGSRGEVVALVADSKGDRRRGGVTGTAPVPSELASILSGPVSLSYGAQSSGPHSPPPPDLARALVEACRRGAPPVPPSPPPSPAAAAAGACSMQDGERLPARRLRAVGTEPFWGARIEGRCVTYSHPDDQKGTRIWTRFTAGPGGGGAWSGALGGKRFELRARPAPGCSDGMSDRRYPLAVDLVVAGERRQGCAEPL